MKIANIFQNVKTIIGNFLKKTKTCFKKNIFFEENIKKKKKLQYFALEFERVSEHCAFFLVLATFGGRGLHLAL